MERIFSKIFLGSSDSLCPGATGQGLGLGCEREQREMEWQPAWVLLSIELQRKERKRIRREQGFVNLAEIQLNLRSARF
jgi:hypothetical protein